MKTLYKLVTLMALMLLCSTMQAQVLNYDFENLNAGDQVAATLGEPWTTWHNAPGSDEDATVSDEFAIGNRSLKIDTGNDVVLKLGDKTAGAYKISLDMFLPEDKIGYFNIMHDYNEGVDATYSLQVWFNSDYNGGGSFLFAGTYYYQFDYVPYNTWNHIDVEINLNDTLAVLKVNENEIFEWDYSFSYVDTRSYGISAMNLCYASSDTNQNGFYVDNLTFAEMNDGSDEVAELRYNLFPNPANDIIHIDGEDLNRAVIYNSSGEMVNVVQIINNSLDIRSLASGRYYLSIINNKGESAIQKIMKN